MGAAPAGTAASAGDGNSLGVGGVCSCDALLQSVLVQVELGPVKGLSGAVRHYTALLAAARVSGTVWPFLCLSCQYIYLLMFHMFLCIPLHHFLKPYSNILWDRYGLTRWFSLRIKLNASPTRSGSSQ